MATQAQPATRTRLVRAAANFRHGTVLPPQTVKRTLADPAGIANVGIPENSADPWKSVAGGIGWTVPDAELAAIGEAIERYAASVCPLPEVPLSELRDRDVLRLDDFSLYSDEQRRSPSFPYRALYDDDGTFTNVFSVLDNREVWVRSALVGMKADAPVTTSSGLAAARNRHVALLRAMQELVERDALMITWLHGVPGRRVELPAAYREKVAALAGEAICIDITPDYSPHPVALVCGQLPVRGRPRYSLGAACRETWSAAVEKAFLEWVQGVAFVGYYLTYRNATFRDASDVRTFDDHAVYYTVRPDEWPKLPLLRREDSERPGDFSRRPPPDSLSTLVHQLAANGISVYYRDLTPCDVRQMGLAVVRAVSPQLAPIGCDQRWLFLGGTVPEVRTRYPWAAALELCFPNPYPHPLG